MTYSIEYVYEIIDKYSSELKNMMKQTDKFESHVKKATQNTHSGFKNFFSRVSSIVTAEAIIEGAKLVVDFFKKCDQAYAESKIALDKVSLSLETVGKNSGKTVDQISSFASSLQNMTSIDADDFLGNVSAGLLKYKNITGDVYDRTQMMIADFASFKFGAAVSGEQFAQTSELIGKAMNEPSKAMKLLRQSGIFLTDSQEKLIKAMEDTGNIKGAQNVIFEAMKDYSGYAEKIGKTSAGMIQKIKVRLGDMMENIGQSIEPLKVNMLELALKFLPYIETAVNAISKIITMVSGILIKIAEKMEGSVSGIIEFADELVNALLYVFQGGQGGNLQGMIEKVFGAISGIIQKTVSTMTKILIALEPVLNIIGKLFAFVIDVLVELSPTIEDIMDAFGDIATVIGEVIQALMPIIDMIFPILNIALKNAIFSLSVLIKIISIAVKIIGIWFKVLFAVYGIIGKLAVNVLKALGFFKAFDAITNIFFSIQKAVLGVFDNLDQTIDNILNSIIESPLFNTIREIIDSIFNAVSDNPVFKMVSGLIDKATSLFGKGKATINTTGNLPAVPSPLNPKVNVNSSVNVNAYTEKGVKVVPFEQSQNLGWNGVMK